MTDYIGYTIQGLFTGIGVCVGSFVYDKYVKSHLEKADRVVTKIKTFEVLNGRREEESETDGKVRQL